MKSFKYFREVALLGVALMLACCNTQPTETNQEAASSEFILVTTAQFEHEKMEIGPPHMKRFEKKIMVKGVIGSPPSGKVQISTFEPGIIRNVKVALGEKVAKGQLLCQMDSKEAIMLQQQYIESAARLKLLESQYQSISILFDEKVASELDFLSIESQYKSEIALYNALRAKLTLINLSPDEVEKGNITSLINITSPAGGFITQHHCVNGLYVESNSFLMEIVDQNLVNLQLYVFQKDIPFLQTGQSIRFNALANKEKVYNATLKMISKSIDPSNNTVLCTAEISETSHSNFIIGQNVDAQIIVSEAEAFGVPDEAVFKVDNRNFLLVKADEDLEGFHFQILEVELGESSNGWTELIDFDHTKNILLRGGYNLIID